MVHKSNIHNKILIADLQLATAAACYGMAIAGQKEASLELLGPFTLNTCRYTLSAILLGKNQFFLHMLLYYLF